MGGGLAEAGNQMETPTPPESKKSSRNKRVMCWAAVSLSGKDRSAGITQELTEYSGRRSRESGKHGDPDAPGITGTHRKYWAVVPRNATIPMPLELQNRQHRNDKKERCIPRRCSAAKTTSRLNCIRDCNGLLFADCKT